MIYLETILCFIMGWLAWDAIKYLWRKTRPTPPPSKPWRRYEYTTGIIPACKPLKHRNALSDDVQQELNKTK